MGTKILGSARSKWTKRINWEVKKHKFILTTNNLSNINSYLCHTLSFHTVICCSYILYLYCRQHYIACYIILHCALLHHVIYFLNFNIFYLSQSFYSSNHLEVWNHLLHNGYKSSRYVLFKVNNRKARAICEICSKLTIKTLERRHWCSSGVLLLTLNRFHTFFWCFQCWTWQVNAFRDHSCHKKLYIYNTHTHTHTHIYIYTYVCMYICIYICIYIYAYMYIYIYIYIYMYLFFEVSQNISTTNNQRRDIYLK